MQQNRSVIEATNRHLVLNEQLNQKFIVPVQNRVTNFQKASIVKSHVIRTTFWKPKYDTTCDICGKSFYNITENNFRQHYDSHKKQQLTAKQNYKCSECSKTFGNNKYNYERHLEWHTKTKAVKTKPMKSEIEFTCELCGREMKTTQTNINIHLKACKLKHNSKTSERCKLCDKEIKGNETNFERHMEKCKREFEIDGKEKYKSKTIKKCKLCDKEIKGNETNFKRHMEKCKKESEIDGKENKPPEVKNIPKSRYECEFCWKKFQYKTNFLSHRSDCKKRSKYTDRNLYKCKKCDFSITNLDDFNSHCMTHNIQVAVSP